MGRAIDTVLGKVTNSTTLTGVTLASGDSLTVRSFDAPAGAYLTNVIVKGAGTATARVLSPSLHDNVRGITVISAEHPSSYSLPANFPQGLVSADTLQFQLTSGAADSSAGALCVYYDDQGGASARLYSPSDIQGLVSDIKPLEVDVTASATIGAWNDTALTTTENLLDANTDYAVLGYVVDVACLCVAVKGADTSSLRVSGPGTTSSHQTVDYFVRRSVELGKPHIPVINAANVNNTTVSVADNAASTAVKVQLILAQLTQRLSR